MLKASSKCWRDPSEDGGQLGTSPSRVRQRLFLKHSHRFKVFKLTSSSPSSLRKRSTEVPLPPPLQGAGEATLRPRAWPREADEEKEVRAGLPGTTPLAASPGSSETGM